MLSDWRFSVPLGMTLAIPALTHQWIVLSAETQLLAVFMLFSSVVYTQAGGAISKYLEERTNAILSEFTALEDANIAALKEAIEAHKSQIELMGQVKHLANYHTEMIQLLLETKVGELKHSNREQTVKDLDGLLLKQESIEKNLKSVFVETVVETVTAKFLEDKKLVASALDSAIDAIDAKEAGQDPVSEQFNIALKEIRADYESKLGKEYSPEDLEDFMEDFEDYKKEFALDLAAALQGKASAGVEITLQSKPKYGEDLDISYTLKGKKLI